MKILVSLISGQTMPNYFGIKYYEPDKCIFLFTEESTQQMEWLKKAVGLPKETIKIDSYNYENIQEKCQKIIKDYGEEELILNYTCGTKIMSIASFEIFMLHRKKTFYVDSENQKILEQESGKNKTIDFNLNISIEEYLSVYGQEIKTSTELKKEYHDAALYIGSNYYRISDQLLYIAKHKSEILKNRKFLKKNISLSSQGQNTQIQIMDKQFMLKDNFENAIKFLTGGWLEYQVYDILKNENIFDDIKLNLQIDWKNKQARDKEKFKNEIDVFCTMNGTAYIFECKSGDITQDTIYKFKALKEFVAGRYAKVLIVTYYKLSPEQVEKIKDFYFTNLELQKLSRFLKELKQNIKKNPNL